MRKGAATAPPRFPPISPSPAASTISHTAHGRVNGPRAGFGAQSPAAGEVANRDNAGVGFPPFTAPAALGAGGTNSSYSPFLSPIISPMTRRQNQRLSSILSIINGTAEHSHHTVRTAWAEQDEEIDDFSESANYRAMFEKNLQDIYRLLELARSVNHKLGSEGDSSAAGIQRDEDHSASKQRRDVAESPETTPAYRQASQKRMLSNEMGAVRHNKKTAKTLVPEVRHEIIAKRKIRNQVHRDEVLSKKHEIDESVQTQKQEALRRKEEAATKWFIIVVVATRVQMAKSLLQRSYRAWKEAKIQKLRRSALRIISRAFRRFYPKWRQNRIRKSANIIQSFFKEVYDVSKLLKIVKRYRLSVITAQRHSRAFLQIRNAQLNAMSLYWDKLEGLWWSQRNKTSQADLEDKKAKKKKKSKKDDAADKITVKIPDL
nr:hypothetical protein HK105_002179 [Polyrhizophydium stewartii]